MDKVIHYCWFGRNPLTDSAKRSIASWKKYAPDYEIRQWDEGSFDCSSCSWSREAYAAGMWAFVADYARFKVLYEYGGIYMDVGSELIRNIEPLAENVPFTAIEEQSLTATTGLIVAVEPRDPVIGACIARYESMDFRNDPDYLSATTVNEVFTSELERIGFKRLDREQHFDRWTVFGSAAFNPVYGFGGYHVKPSTYSIHRSSGSWVEPKYRIKRAVVRTCSPFLGRRVSQVLGRILMELVDGGVVAGSKEIIGVVKDKLSGRGRTKLNAFSKDTFHYYGEAGIKVNRLLTDLGYRYVFYLRMCQAGGFKKLIFTLPRKHLSRLCGLEISPCTQIGEGFYIGHPYGITINCAAKLGRNVNIHKGCTIGQENRGHRKGVPTIGDRVYLGINSTIAGNVTIGNDVFIASNTFVNQDIPDHSIVVGNPCKVIEKQDATGGYVVNLV